MCGLSERSIPHITSRYNNVMDDPLFAPTPPRASNLPTEAPNEADLLRACRDGNPAAWEAVVAKYERLVYSIPLRMGLDRDEAADIFQLTFSALLTSLDAIRDEAKLGGWLATVARRHTWAAIGRSKAELSLSDISTDEANLAEDAAVLGAPNAGRIQTWEMSLWLDQGLAKLADKCRDLLTALYLDVTEPSYTDLAKRLNIAVGSIGPTRARCLERLRQLLQAD